MQERYLTFKYRLCFDWCKMDHKLIIAVIIAVIFLVGCEGKVVSTEDVWLETSDGKKLGSTVWYSRGEKAVILIHMLDHDRTDWRYFAKKLNVFRITAIGIDLRGHGESVDDWKDFSEQDFNNMIRDVESAKKVLEKNGKKSISIIGASIGANIALKYAAQDSDIKSVVLLSPGINYKGINVENDTEIYDRPVLIIVSKEDTYPYESSQIIYEKAKGEKELYTVEGLGHGTDMLPKSQDMENKIVEFLTDTLK